MKRIYLIFIILLFLPFSSSAVEEPAYTEVGFNIGEVYEFIVLDVESIFFSVYTLSPNEKFNMTVKSLPEEGFRASGIDFQYGNNTYLRPMHANSRLEYFIYNNWEYWTEIGTYNRTGFNSIGSVSVSDTSFIFNGTSGLDAEDVYNWYLVYDLNGVIISEEFMVNGILKRHFERVFPIESTTEPTTTTLIITSNGATITDATIIDPLPLSFSYLYILFLPILLKFKYRK